MEIMLRRAAQGAWGDMWDGAGGWEEAGTKVAVASSSYADKAGPLLEAFEIRPGVPMAEVVDEGLVEIYYRKREGKRAHFEQISRKSGVRFEDMLFFDDAQENINTVSELGVVCVHTPDGLTAEAWRMGLEQYVRSLTAPQVPRGRLKSNDKYRLAQAYVNRARAQDDDDAALAAAAKAE